MKASEARMRLEVIKKALQYARSGATFTRNEMFANAPENTREFTRKILQRLVKEGALRRIQLPGQATSHYRVKDVDFFTSLMENDEKLADFIWPGQATPTLEQVTALSEELKQDPDGPQIDIKRREDMPPPQLVLIDPVTIEPLPKPPGPVIATPTAPVIRKAPQSLSEPPPQLPAPTERPAPQPFTPIAAPTGPAFTADSLAETNRLLGEMVSVHKDVLAVHKELLDLLGAAFQSIIYSRDKIDALEKDVTVVKEIMEKLV